MIHLGVVFSDAVWNLVGGSTTVLCGVTIISVFITIITDQKKNQKEIIPKKKIQMFCPYCGIMSKHLSEFCTFCGSSLANVAEMLGLKKLEVHNENICPFCSCPIQNSECIACGRSIKQ